MPRPRKALIALDATPYYHCVSRCVRRAWVAERLHVLASVFAIDLAAYAVMSNHTHVVVRVDATRAATWSVREALERWGALFRGPELMHRFLEGETLDDAALASLERLAARYRERLGDISWFMRCLNESIARAANAEDGCTGHFWEGRFRSQALLDETALLTCMAYVDLNPIRAGIASTPEASDYTSIQERLGIVPDVPAHASAREPHLDPAAHREDCVAGSRRRDAQRRPPPPGALLLPFAGDASLPASETALPLGLRDYLELVDWTGRIVRADKRGAIPEQMPPILERLAIAPAQWVDATQHFGRRYFTAIGPPTTLDAWRERLGQCWVRGARRCALLYPDPSPA